MPEDGAETTPKQGEPAQPTRLNSDLKELVEHYHTNSQTIGNLLKGGVKVDDLEDVLEIRDGLSRQTFWLEEKKGTVRDREAVDIVSAEAISRAYRTVGGNLDDLRMLVEKTTELVGNLDFDDKLRLGLRTRTLNYVVDLYEDGNLTSLEE